MQPEVNMGAHPRTNKRVTPKSREFYRTSLGVLYKGDSLLALKHLPDNSVDCIIGSPPYFSVRDYKVKGQIGLEASVDEYLGNICAVYTEAMRVLRPTGSCWVVIGDLYVDKNLMLLPARFALYMQAQKWILRNDIIWRKTRCLPHPVKDRLISTHEHIYHFVKQPGYYYDLDSIRLPHAPSSLARIKSKIKISHKGRYGKDKGNRGRTIDALNETTAVHPKGRNPGDVFDACPSNAADGHLATYPESLIVPRILSTCPPEGTVLDFWMGSGTTALVAEKLNRRWIGIELNTQYCKIAKKRLEKPRQGKLIL